MSRHTFGGSIADYTVAAGGQVTVNGVTGNELLLVPGAQVTFWDASSVGNQITDLTDMGNSPITAVTADANGGIPQLYGPDGVRQMWADGSGGSGPRRLMIATDIGTDLTTLEGEVAGLPTALAGLSDVNLGTPTDGELLTYDAASQKWMAEAGSGSTATDRVLKVATNAIYAYDYGYRADGQQSSAAANTAAIQNAINDAAAQQARVILPPGYGYITAPGIELKSRVWLQGAGHYATVLQLADNANCHMIYNHVSVDGTTDPNAMFCGVLDLGLDCRGAHQSGAGPYYGISLDTNPFNTLGSSDLAMDATHLVQNVYVRNAYNDGIHVNGRSDSRIIACKVSNAGGNAFRVAFDTHVIGCVAEKPSLAGFLVEGSSTQLTNCKAYICGQSATSVNGRTGVPNSGHGYVVTGTGIGEVTLTACDAQQVSGHGFHVTGGAAGVVLAGCTVQEASYGNGTSFVAFNVDNATNCVINGVSKVDNSMNSVRLVNGADKCDVTVTHSLTAGQTTLADALSSDTVLLNSRVVVNGVTRSTIPAWAASTAYVTGQQVTYLGATYRATANFTSGASFTVSNWALVSAPLPATIVPAGQYVFASGGASPGTSNTTGIGTLRAYPVYIPHTVTLTGIGAEVSTIGDAGSKIRLGIYAGTGNLTPGTLVLDAGQIAGDSATVQTLTISQTLNPGIYWVCAVVQAVTTTQPTMRIFTPTWAGLPMSSAPSAGASACAYTHGTTVSGALPATFSVGGLISSAPRLHLKG